MPDSLESISLESIIASIKDDGTIRSFDEAKVINGVILRVLSRLGWDIFETKEVKPEHNVGNGKVDFALIISDQTKVFIEVKRPRENLEQHQQQLLDYSFQGGVKLSVLTNGLTWWFYLPLMEGVVWEKRRFYTIDILEQPSHAVAEKLIEFLSRDNIDSEDAFTNAEKIYHNKHRKTKIREALPKALGKLVDDPDDLLVDLIIETTEKQCGHRPELDEVAEFLKSTEICQTGTNENIKKTILPSAANTRQRRPTTSTSRESDINKKPDSYINKKPERFRFLGTEYHPQTWKELLKIVAEQLYNDHHSEFDSCLSLKGTKMVYFSKDKNALSIPQNISGSDFYFEAKLNADSIVKRARGLMGLFGYNDSDLEITIQ